MRKSLLLAGMALALALPSVTVAQSEDALSAYERKDVPALTAMAEQGNADAQFLLAVMYDTGEGVTKDSVLAVALYRKAAEQGNAYAQANLGLSYAKGEGVGKNNELAVAWWRKAAEQGYADAQNNIGFMYDIGKGVPQNYVAAVAWYRKSANQGNSKGQFSLSAAYYNGRGIQKNYVESYKWIILSLANTEGLERHLYIRFRDEIAVQLTKAQIAEAQRLASIWKPEK